MNNYFNFRDFEIIKKGSQNTILKASDNKGLFFAIKIEKKKSSSVLIPSYSAPVSSSTFQSPSLRSASSCLLPPSQFYPSSSFISPPLLLKGNLKKEKEFLMDLQGIRGIPNFLFGGFDPEIERFVIIEELTGHNLEYYFKKYKKFSISTTLKITLQIFKILRGIHERGIIHRDIKPTNLALSQNGKDIMLLDFGLAHRLTSKISENKKRKKQIKFIGDLKFCGLNAHFFKNNTKIDDLVSLGILLIYFLQGSLNWDYRENSNFSRSAEKIWFKKVNFISQQVPTLYPLLYPYFKYLLSAKHDSINYDYLLNVIETWAHFEQVDLTSENWDWSEEKRDSFDNNCENWENSMENFQEESEETMVSELIINYRVPNL